MQEQEVAGFEVSKRSYTLKELVENYKQIEEQIVSSGGEVGDELVEMHRIANDLVTGKFDRVCSAKDAIAAHTEACKKQIEYNNGIVSKIDAMIEEAVRSTEEKKITGLVYSAKVKKNPPAVVVKSEEDIPTKFFNFKVNISEKFNFEEKEKMERYKQFILNRNPDDNSNLTEGEVKMLEDYIETVLDKNAVKAALKNNELVPGVVLESGESIKIDKSKVSSSKMIEG